MFDAARSTFAVLFLLLLSGSLALPSSAQEVLVQNGATAAVSNGGVWDLQGATMDFGEAGATARLNEQAAGRVTGGLLTAIRALNGPDGADPAGLGAELSASVNLGEVTITRGHAAQIAENGNESIERYYDISPSENNGGLSATLTHSYADAELNGRTESELELFKSTDGGSTWSEEGFDSRDASGNTVTLGGIESFSRWTLGSESNPLPVELASFEATQAQASGGSEEAVQLTWKTVSETGNAGFEIQRQAEGTSSNASWEQVGYRESKAESGTTSEALTYRFTDEELPYAADTLTYRLRQVDTDGSAELTDPVRVARSGVNQLQLKKTYPNPAQSRVTVRYAVPEETASEGEVRLRLYDVLGRQVRTVKVKGEAGRHGTQLSVNDLASGVYVLRLQGTEQSLTRRLTVVR